MFLSLQLISIRADSRFAPSQRETMLLCNGVSHWLGANLKSALSIASDTALAPNRLLAHTWIKDDSICWRIYASACLNGLKQPSLSAYVTHPTFHICGPNCCWCHGSYLAGIACISWRTHTYLLDTSPRSTLAGFIYCTFTLTVLWNGA